MCPLRALAVCTHPQVLLRRLQYIFSVRKANCVVAPCATLTFPSRSPTAALTGLEPGTKVGSLRAGISCHCAGGVCLTCLTHPSWPLQYNVTVVGVTKTGMRTPGTNRLQFTTPAPAVRLTVARALGPTRGTANATALPKGYFATVSLQKA